MWSGLRNLVDVNKASEASDGPWAPTLGGSATLALALDVRETMIAASCESSSPPWPHLGLPAYTTGWF